MVDRDDRIDYFEANQGRLLDVAGEIERLTGAEDSIKAEQSVEHNGEIVLTENAPSAEGVRSEFEADDIYLDDTSAQEVADVLHRGLIAQASMDIETTSTRMKRHYLAKLNPQTEEEIPAPLAFEQATAHEPASWQQTIRYAEDGTKVTATTTRLGRSGAYDSFICYSVQDDDNLITQSFTALAANERIISATFSTQPAEDELLHESLKFFDTQENQAQLFMLLAGGYKDEDGLETSLSELWLSQQTKWSEEEAGPLLDRIRQRAIAAQHSAKLKSMHGLNMPSISALEELKNRLASL